MLMIFIKNYKNIEHMTTSEDLQKSVLDTISSLFSKLMDEIFYLISGGFGKYFPLCKLDCKYTKYVFLDKLCNCPTEDAGKKCRKKWECKPCSSNNSTNVNGLSVGNCKGTNDGFINGFCCNFPSNVGIGGECREDSNCSSGLVCRGNLGGTINGNCDKKNELENSLDDIKSFIPSW